MSIVALKRKTQTQYNNMSVGQKNFSLNGTHRNQGFIGQTMLSRSLPRTLMKGPTPKGHGGCCGIYPQGPIIQSAVTSTEDPTVIKNSVLDTNAVLIDKHKLVRVDATTLSTVKPDINQHLNTQGSYIDNLSNKMTSFPILNNANKTPLPVNNTCLKGIVNAPNGYNSYTRSAYCQNVKPRITSTNLPLNEFKSGDVYTLNKSKLCTNNDKFIIQKSTMRQPLPGN